MIRVRVYKVLVIALWKKIILLHYSRVFYLFRFASVANVYIFVQSPVVGFFLSFEIIRFLRSTCRCCFWHCQCDVCRYAEVAEPMLILQTIDRYHNNNIIYNYSHFKLKSSSIKIQFEWLLFISNESNVFFLLFVLYAAIGWISTQTHTCIQTDTFTPKKDGSCWYKCL